MLELRKALTGVASSSLEPPLGVDILGESLYTWRRGAGVLVGVTEAASLGVCGDLVDRQCAARVGIRGDAAGRVVVPLFSLLVDMVARRAVVVFGVYERSDAAALVQSGSGADSISSGTLIHCCFDRSLLS